MLLDFLQGVDDQVLLFIQEYLRFPWLTPIMEFITSLGDGGFVWIVAAVALLCTKRYRKTGIAVAVALLIGYVTTSLVLKNLIMRVRPYEAVAGLTSLIGPVGESSFPSGHTTSSFAASLTIRKGTSRLVGALAILLAVLIALSRLYVGVHYPTDVLAGALVGLFASVCAKRVVRA